MPIYDYLCSNCGVRTEVIHGISAAGPRFCPACGAEGTLRKAFAPPAVHFKGSGWAKKDRTSGSSKSPSKPDSAPDSAKKPSGAGEGSPSGDSTSPASSGSSSGSSSGDGSASSKTSSSSSDIAAG